MYKDYRYINAGTNEIYRWGKKAVAYASTALTPNEKGFYNIPVDGDKYWTIGTSNGKYGEFAKVNDTFFSVNKAGFMYAKAGTDKGEKFVEAVKSLINAMNERHYGKADENEEEE